MYIKKIKMYFPGRKYLFYFMCLLYLAYKNQPSQNANSNCRRCYGPLLSLCIHFFTVYREAGLTVEFFHCLIQNQSSKT